MLFTKTFSASLFAALAVSIPLPAPQVSVDYGQIQALSSSVKSFAESTASQFNSVSGQSDALSASFSGSTQQSLAQLFSSLSASVTQIQQASSQVAQALDSATASYEQTESGNAGAFGSLRARDSAVALEYANPNNRQTRGTNDAPNIYYSAIGSEYASVKRAAKDVSTYQLAGVPVSSDDSAWGKLRARDVEVDEVGVVTGHKATNTIIGNEAIINSVPSAVSGRFPLSAGSDGSLETDGRGGYNGVKESAANQETTNNP